MYRFPSSRKYVDKYYRLPNGGGAPGPLPRYNVISPPPDRIVFVRTRRKRISWTGAVYKKVIVIDPRDPSPGLTRPSHRLRNGLRSRPAKCTRGGGVVVNNAEPHTHTHVRPSMKRHCSRLDSCVHYNVRSPIRARTIGYYSTRTWCARVFTRQGCVLCPNAFTRR